MENYREMLSYLIDLKKKKKEPNQQERVNFEDAWKSMVLAEGYSRDAEEFLYSGLTFCGAQPLFEYIKSKDYSESALQEFFSGDKYGENCASTVTVLLHLFAIFLSKKEVDPKLLVRVIEKIPHAFVNKEGKHYGQANRAFKKYVLDEMHCGFLPKWRCLFEAGISRQAAEEFKDTMTDLIESMDISKYNKNCQKNAESLRSWLIQASDISKEKTENEKTYSDNLADNVTGSKEINLKEKCSCEEQKPVPNEVSVEVAERALEEKDRKIRELINRCEAQKIRIRELTEQLTNVESEKTKKLEELQTAREKVENLHRILAVNRVLIEERERDIENLKKELAAKDKFIDVVDGDSERKSEEALNRLAARLNVEYRDFMDCINIPMSSELGENMREQLNTVFSILKKSGINLK